MYKLLQLHKLDKKECFNLFIAKGPSLRATQFLSFQTLQKMHRGTEFQIFVLFFPIKELLQLSKASLAILGKNKQTPIREKMIFHRELTLDNAERCDGLTPQHSHTYSVYGEDVTRFFVTCSGLGPYPRQLPMQKRLLKLGRRAFKCR